MSRVYYAIPSARPPEEALPNLRQWQERGYKVMLQRDLGAPLIEGCMQVHRPYAGYAEAVNQLVAAILNSDPKAEWIVTGGDDMLPDPNKSAEEIAKECSNYFAFDAGLKNLYPCKLVGESEWLPWSTFGVMQPTGDRWLVNGPGTKPGSECVAGSPWMGREWCRRINGGRGPLWPEYFHMGEDEELMEVAIKYGVFWQRPDLTQHHSHWGRPRDNERMAPASRMPDFLKRANSKDEWNKYKTLISARRTSGWPGSEPIP